MNSGSIILSAAYCTQALGSFYFHVSICSLNPCNSPIGFILSTDEETEVQMHTAQGHMVEKRGLNP